MNIISIDPSTDTEIHFQCPLKPQVAGAYMELATSHSTENPKNPSPGYLKQIIRDLGLKVTSQRIVILETLLTGRAHVTAQEVFEVVSVKSPDVGFATVYRFLRTLCSHGYVTEVRMGGLPARYEWAKKKHHDHLTCVKCRKICEFENLEIESLQLRIAQSFGFQLTNHLLELYGVCSDCQRIPDRPILA